jgi:hypothetical protein
MAAEDAQEQAQQQDDIKVDSKALQARPAA